MKIETTVKYMNTVLTVAYEFEASEKGSWDNEPDPGCMYVLEVHTEKGDDITELMADHYEAIEQIIGKEREDYEEDRF